MAQTVYFGAQTGSPDLINRIDLANARPTRPVLVYFAPARSFDAIAHSCMTVK
jgi:hypothetical protein